MEFTNASGHTRYLFANRGVSAAIKDIRQAVPPGGSAPWFFAKRTVTFRPGTTAHTVPQVVNVANFRPPSAARSPSPISTSAGPADSRPPTFRSVSGPAWSGDRLHERPVPPARSHCLCRRIGADLAGHGMERPDLQAICYGLAATGWLLRAGCYGLAGEESLDDLAAEADVIAGHGLTPVPGPRRAVRPDPERAAAQLRVPVLAGTGREAGRTGSARPRRRPGRRSRPGWR
jgi:hypothetical protein